MHSELRAVRQLAHQAAPFAALWCGGDAEHEDAVAAAALPVQLVLANHAVGLALQHSNALGLRPHSSCYDAGEQQTATLVGTSATLMAASMH
jgi:hypothetical protein